ncbi:hypothetical protein GCM10020256_36160 [Streptomyces thermocoprophilus]
MPQAGAESGEDIPYGGQALTSVHCPTLRRSVRELPPKPQAVPGPLPHPRRPCGGRPGKVMQGR